MVVAVVELTIAVGMPGTVSVQYRVTSVSNTDIRSTHSVECYLGSLHGHWGRGLMCPQWIWCSWLHSEDQLVDGCLRSHH